MAKKSQPKKPNKIETDPGAWDRFEHAVDAAVKSGPKHRKPTEKSKQSPKRKKQKHETR